MKKTRKKVKKVKIQIKKKEEGKYGKKYEKRSLIIFLKKWKTVDNSKKKIVSRKIVIELLVDTELISRKIENYKFD